MWDEIKKTLGTSEWILLSLCALGAMATSYLLFFSSVGSHLEQELLVGKLKTEGAVRRRHAQSLVWTDEKDRANLYQKDIIYVPAGVKASIEFGKDKSVLLDPESMVQLDDVARERLQIIVYSGKAKGDVEVAPPKPVSRIRWFARPKTRLPLLPPAIADHENLKLLASEWMQRVDTALEGTKLPVTKLFALKDVPKVFGALDDYEIKLVLPKNQVYNISENSWLPFEWTGLPNKGIKYELDVSSTADFKQFLTYQTDKTHLSVQFQDPGDYYWRIRAARGKETLFSDKANFNVKRLTAKEEVSRRLPASGTPGGPFALEIARDADFKDLVKAVLISEPKCPTAGLALGSYYCRVTSIDPTSKFKSFTYPFHVP